MADQLALGLDVEEAPPPAPVAGPVFYVAGWRVWRMTNAAYGGGKMDGWRACLLDRPAGTVMYGAYSARPSWRPAPGARGGSDD